MTTTETEQARLVQQAQQGDREAMTAIYEQTSPALWRTIRSMVQDPELARDVQQETYLHAFTAIEQLHDPAKLLPWLRAIAQNQAKNALQKQQPVLFSELERGVPEPPDPDVSPEQTLEAGEQAELLQEVLSTLGNGQRMIVGMYYYEQRSVKEIAEALGLSQGTVKSQLHRGRKRIEQALARRKKEELSLLGIGMPGLGAFCPVCFPRFVRAWRSQPAPEGDSAQLLQRVLTQLPRQGSAVLTASSGRALAMRALATLATAALLGGAALGIGLLGQARRERPVVPQPEETETEQLRMDADRPTQPEPTEAETQAPTEVTEPTEPPTEAPTEASTEALTEPPAEAPEELPPATEAPAQETEAPFPATEASATLPTETSLPSYLGEITIRWPENETVRFQTDEELLVRSSDYALSVRSEFENGWQTVTLLAGSGPARNVLVSVCRDNGTYGWVPLVHVTITIDFEEEKP